MNPSLPVLFILGPTASGKTGIGLELAQRFACQLISCDSSLVYRGMDIGTAKPTVAEQRLAPHRLVDICEPSAVYSVARYCTDAKDEIAKAQAVGKVPVLLGGTMFYFNALEQGLAAMPVANEQLRRDIAQRAANAGWPALHKSLQPIDPAAAARIHPHDTQRIQRALEVFEATGRSISAWQNDAVESSAEWLHPLYKFALYPADRAALHARIAERLEHMLDSGFVNEVRRLRADPRNDAELPSMRSVGYRQAWRFLDGEFDEQAFVQKTLAATRQLAKRQLTWIRGMENLVLIDSLVLSRQNCVEQITRTLAADGIVLPDLPA